MNPSLRSKSSWKIERLKEEVKTINKDKLKIPFIAISESWLKPHIEDAQIVINNYNVFRADRKKSKNGGSLVYIHNEIPIEETDTFDDDVCSAVICSSKRWRCIIASVYRPPSSSKESFSKMLKFISEFIEKRRKSNKYQLFIFGDYNFPNIEWKEFDSDLSASQENQTSNLKNFMDNYFLTQYVRESTRKKNILDLFLTDDPNFVNLVRINDISISDHYLVEIFTTFFDGLEKPKQVEKTKKDISELDFTKLNLNTSDFTKINQEFSQIDWKSMVEKGIESFPSNFNYAVYTVVKRYSKIYNPKKRFYASTYTKKRHIINRKVRKYRKKASNFNLDDSKREEFQKKITSLLEEKKKSFLEERLSKENDAVNKIKSNPKYFYSYANRSKKVSSSPSLLVDAHDNTILEEQHIADLLQDHFKNVFSEPRNCDSDAALTGEPKIYYPLSDLELTNTDVIDAINEMKPTSSCPKQDIPARVLKNCKNTLCVPLRIFWEKSFCTGTIPKEYKTQLIIPLHKKGLKTKAENYRPISLTSHVIKIFERILRRKITDFLDNNGLINSGQHGFRKNRNCLTQLLDHLNYVMTNSIEDIRTDCIYIDYAKAFDKVDHHILISKLKYYTINGKYSKWIQNFVSGRTQTVQVNNTLSYSTPVLSGVPQGSVLGPLLFVLYINDLPNNIQQSRILTFADDTKLVAKADTEHDRRKLQEDLNHIIEWSEKNNMRLNSKKFELISYDFNSAKCNNTDENVHYKADNNIEIWPSLHVRDLGVYLDKNMSWNTHRSIISEKAKRICSWVFSVFYTRKPDVMLPLFNSLVRSKLEYCNELWNPHEIKEINKIESIQRSFTYRLKGMQTLNYWERLKALNIMSLQRRRERSIIIYVWKIKNAIYPNCIQLEFKEHKRSDTITAKVKPLCKTQGRIRRIYEESFIIKSAQLWNILPAPLTRITELPAFKKELTKFLKDIPDEPPISGYVGTSKNSLVDKSLLRRRCM